MDENGRWLQTQEKAEPIFQIILATVGIALAIGALAYYCCRKRGRQLVEFQVFKNEQSAPTCKDGPINASGTTDVISLNDNLPAHSKDEDEEVNTTSESKKRRRRKKDRLQQHSTHHEEIEQQPNNKLDDKKELDESFDIE